MILTGVARVDITPPIGISHAGWGAALHEKAEGIDMPLYSTSLYLKSESTEEEIIIIDLDLCILTSDLDNQIRNKITSFFPIKKENIRISVSHTHAGPALGDGVWLEGGREYLESYKILLPELILRSVNDSVKNAIPARIGVKKGHCDININRRPADNKGNFFTGRNWEGVVDREVIVIGFDDVDGKPIATIVDYACHPTILGPENKLISPDYPGHMRFSVEQNIGGLCLFLQGAAGNQGPVHTFLGDVEIARKAGKILGLEASKLRTQLDPFKREEKLIDIVPSGADLGMYEDVSLGEPSDVINIRNKKIHLDSLEFPDVIKAEELYQKSLEKLYNARESGDESLVKSIVSETKRANFIKNLSNIAQSGKIELWIQTFRVGDVILQSIPVEPFAETGIGIKGTNVNGIQILFSGYSNGSFGYLPLIDAYEEGGYEPNNTPFAAGTAEIVEKICVEEIKNITDS